MILDVNITKYHIHTFAYFGIWKKGQTSEPCVILVEANTVHSIAETFEANTDAGVVTLDEVTH